MGKYMGNLARREYLGNLARGNIRETWREGNIWGTLQGGIFGKPGEGEALELACILPLLSH